MAYKKDEDFKWSIRGIDRIIEEKGSNFIRLANIAWGVGDDEDCDPDKIRLDIRKYRTDSEGKEIMGRGVSFMTEDGPNELVHVLLEEGYGATEKSLQILSKRKDFKNAVFHVSGQSSPDDELDETFDLRDYLS